MSLAVFDFVNEILFPEYCITCNKSGCYICAKCLKTKYKINFLSICHICGNTTFKGSVHKECRDYSNVDNLFFFCEYNNSAKSLIESIKYQGNFAIVDTLVLHMANYLRVIYPNYKEFVFTYVPSHWVKQNVRGFNQSKLITEKLGKILGVEVVGYLKKTNASSKQAGSSKEQRNRNLKGKFALEKTIISKNVMIIDDVHTTGATLNECAAILKDNGAEVVYGYTFSKSMNYSPNALDRV